MTMQPCKWNECAGPRQRWVCAACGKSSEPGAARDTLPDTSCVMWAVLCEADQVNGKWIAAEASDAVSSD